jgi:hypothetical protein
VGSCECGDEPSGSGTTELVSYCLTALIVSGMFLNVTSLGCPQMV